MKKRFRCLLLLCCVVQGLSAQQRPLYISNQKPLTAQPYTALPLGTIKAKGWLLRMLQLQRNGLTGHLDSLYPEVCGATNAWLGGEGDAWERGPYWLDGLVPLAYLLDDKELKQKAQKWIEWSIAHQRADGYFGPQPPAKPLPQIPGVQNTDHEDWWPKMVMLKVLQQYYTATNDKRVINLMSRYFRYMLNNLPQKPLGHWTYWGEQRGGDNLAVVYWLYNITKEDFLLKLGDLIYRQTTPWKTVFSDGELASLNPYPHYHCVNVAQGIKTPGIQFQRTGDSSYLLAVKQGLKTVRAVHGFASGMYGADENMHGNDPSQGSELCSAVEMMFSFESILPITGDASYADYLEKIAFNVLPAQHNDDFTQRQYFQQPNQIEVSYTPRNFFENEPGRLVFGLLTGYPCCTANMHQGYPKYVQNLWYASADGGLAALVYGASEVTATLPNGTQASFKEETSYPFEERINFTYTGNRSAAFPLHLRLPQWCSKGSLTVNGEAVSLSPVNNIVVIRRQWKPGDKVQLNLPMDVRTSRWAENSVAVERGPLLYALKIDEQQKAITNASEKGSFTEVYAASAWNYGIASQAIKNKNFLVQTKAMNDMPWNQQNAPIEIITEGKRLKEWVEYNHSAGKLPRSTTSANGAPAEKIMLIPYGCTALRISEFPVAD